MEIALTIGSLLRQARKQTRTPLQKVSQATGISVSWLSSIENGAEPKLIDFLSLCKFYGVSWAKVIELGVFGQKSPAFKNEQYENEILNQLPFEIANTIQSASITLPDQSTDEFWIGTINNPGSDIIQVHLVVTSDQSRMIDEA